MSIKDQFYVPLEVRSRRGRGGEFNFVAWQDVANRLNDIFGINWSSELKTSEIVGSNIIVRVRITVRNPETNVDYWQEGFGGAVNDERLEAGSPFKAAYSKAIKDACKKWGLGLYLEDEDKPSYNVTPGSGATNPVSDSKVPDLKVPVIPQAIPSKPKLPRTTTEAVPSFAQPQREQLQNNVNTPPLPKKSVQSQGQPQKQTGSAVPPRVPPTQGKSVPSVVKSMDIDKTMISDVQKVALEGQLLSNSVTFIELAGEAFKANEVGRGVPKSKDDLTYDEAVLIIKYGNDKFRRA